MSVRSYNYQNQNQKLVTKMMVTILHEVES